MIPRHNARVLATVFTLLLIAVFSLPAFGSTPLEPANGSLQARLTDERGAALADAEVILVDLGAKAVTDKAGECRFGDLPAGEYTVLIQWQRHALIELSDEAISPDSVGRPAALVANATMASAQRQGEAAKQEQEAFHLLPNTLTVDLMAHHSYGSRLRGTIGVNGMTQSNDTQGPIPLVPDASIRSAAGFLFEEVRMGRFSFLCGARGDARKVTADPNELLNLEEDKRSYGEFSGDAGIVARPAEGIALAANAGRAWRAPTLFELFARGPQVAEERFLIGLPSLHPERSLNLDGSVRWQFSRHRGEVAIYRNRIDRFIYLQPTDEERGDLRVWNYLQADAVLSGIEVGLEEQVTGPLSLQGRFDLVRGELGPSGDPLPSIPPERGVVGAETAWSGLGWADLLRAGAEVEMVGRKTRATESERVTGSYVLFNGDLGLERVLFGRHWDLSVRVRNAANRGYRDFLSRYKEFAQNPGRDLSLRVRTTF